MQNSYSIYQSNGTDKATLREIVDSIPGQIAQATISSLAKNTRLSGNPRAGSVKVSRLMGATVNDYGTARTARAGGKVKDNYITVLLNQDKEVVEEINKFDLETYGLDGILEQRKEALVFAFAQHLDSAFFTEAEAEGTEVTATGSTIVDRVEHLIQSLETVKNTNVNGVPRSMMMLSLTPEAMGKLANAIDVLPNPVNGGVDVTYFHNVKVYSNVNQTEEAILMAVGSIAQPVIMSDVKQEDIQFSNEVGVAFFFKYGTEAVTPDLIFYGDIITESASA